jgi:glycosyltransferase involved in cell wall biosynthesis
LGDRIETLGIPVYVLKMVKGRPGLRAFWKLVSIVRDQKPDLIQGWMYHGNIAATMAAGISARQIAVSWNIRHCIYDLGAEKRMTAFLIRLGARLSFRPVRIVYNSNLSLEQHTAIGYKRERGIVIPNGFDTDVFRPSEKSRRVLREECGLGPDSIIIGLISRYHPMKDHENFLKAAALVTKKHPDVYFLMAGRDIDEGNDEIMGLVRELGLSSRVILLGERNDIHEITAGLDIATSSSWSEAFPNVVGEAMACAVPCVVTDVGDSALIVGDTGRVVPPRDPDALAGGFVDLISIGKEGRKRLGDMARERIKREFSISKLVDRYERVYREIASGGR